MGSELAVDVIGCEVGEAEFDGVTVKVVSSLFQLIKTTEVLESGEPAVERVGLPIVWLRCANPTYYQHTPVWSDQGCTRRKYGWRARDNCPVSRPAIGRERPAPRSGLAPGRSSGAVCDYLSGTCQQDCPLGWWGRAIPTDGVGLIGQLCPDTI